KGVLGVGLDLANWTMFVHPGDGHVSFRAEVVGYFEDYFPGHEWVNNGFDYYVWIHLHCFQLPMCNDPVLPVCNGASDSEKIRELVDVVYERMQSAYAMYGPNWYQNQIDFFESPLLSSSLQEFLGPI